MSRKKLYQLLAFAPYIQPFHIMPHKLLLKVRSEAINFVFKSKIRKRFGFSKTSIYWTSKGAGRRYFIKQTLVNVISFLIIKCSFAIGNIVFKPDIGIPMGINPVPFWVKLFLYFIFFVLSI